MPFERLLSIVIPCYRSELYLERTVDEIRAFFEPLGRFEIVLVNDGSPDNVQRVIERLHHADPRVRFIELGSNQGQHAATLRGFVATRGDVVLTLDDDGQNPPESGQRVAEGLRSSTHDIVYGRFRTTQQSLLRLLASRLNRWSSKVTLGNTAGVSISNVRAIRGDMARAMGRAAGRAPYIDVLVFAATRRIGEVEVDHRERNAGESNYSVRALIALWVAHMTTLSVFPLQLATRASFFVAAAGFLMGVGQMARALIEQRAPAGWLSLFTAVMFLFSVLFVFLGIIGTYLGRMYVNQSSKGLDWVRSSGGIDAADGR